jgi:hypothetical protein
MNPRALGALPAAPVYSHWTVFSHPGFGFELPVPPGAKALSLRTEPATEARFISEDGDFTITASGGVFTDYPPRVMEAEWTRAQSLPGRYINYQRKTASWFVVSGVERNRTEFYQKLIIRGHQIATFTLTYPHSRVADFDSWVSAIEDRFSVVPVKGGPQSAHADSVAQPPAPNPSRRDSRAKKQSPKTASSEEINAKVDLTPPKKVAKRSEAVKKPENAKKTPPARPSTGEQTTKEDLPYGTPVVGKRGFAYSPYASDKVVDVVDLPRGTKVKCPYTGKVFRVP